MIDKLDGVVQMLEPCDPKYAVIFAKRTTHEEATEEDGRCSPAKSAIIACAESPFL